MLGVSLGNGWGMLGRGLHGVSMRSRKRLYFGGISPCLILYRDEAEGCVSVLLFTAMIEPNHRHNKDSKKYHTKDNTKAVHNANDLNCLYSVDYKPKTFAACLAASPCRKRTSLTGW